MSCAYNERVLNADMLPVVVSLFPACHQSIVKLAVPVPLSGCLPEAVCVNGVTKPTTTHIDSMARGVAWLAQRWLHLVSILSVYPAWAANKCTISPSLVTLALLCTICQRCFMHRACTRMCCPVQLCSMRAPLGCCACCRERFLRWWIWQQR